MDIPTSTPVNNKVWFYRVYSNKSLYKPLYKPLYNNPVSIKGKAWLYNQYTRDLRNRLQGWTMRVTLYACSQDTQLVYRWVRRG